MRQDARSAPRPSSNQCSSSRMREGTTDLISKLSPPPAHGVRPL
jgi:hypothetical protein